MGEYEIETRTATPEERERLKDTQVLHVSRVMEAEGRPIAFLVDVLPGKLFSEIEFRRDFSGSVLDLLLRQKDLRVTSADTEIHAAAAESNEARALHMQRGDVVLHFKSTLFSMDGSIIDVSRSYFLPGYFRFHVIRRVEPRRTSN
jgi:GntR family transcriptional regulator